VSDDVSKLFPVAMAVLTETRARAVIVTAWGSPLGMNGCAPAFLFDMKPEGAAANTQMVRAIRDHLRAIADRMEDDMRAKGVPLEPLQ
jgi:hypothetical protein